MNKERSGCLFLILHPLWTLKTVLLRKETEIFDDFAPTNYTGIPLESAVRGVMRDRKGGSKGIETEWSRKAINVLNKGPHRPNGQHPMHNNL